MSDDFDWGAADAEGTISVSEQAAIACYTNPFGNVVLRQEGRFGPEDDTWIVCHPMHVEALARALLQAGGRNDLVIVPVSQIGTITKDGNDRLVIPFERSDLLAQTRAKERQHRKDRTAAERRRRQRQRERDNNSNADVTTVTPAGPVTVSSKSVTGRVVPIAPGRFEQESERQAHGR